MVPSVKILGLGVRFEVREDAKILPSLLRCFPNVERLHIESKKAAEPNGKLNLKFWEEAGDIECVQSHVNLMIFRDFRGDRSELSFLKFFLESARMLKRLVIVYPNGSFTSRAEANSKVKPLFAAKRASTSLLLVEGAYADGQEPIQLKTFKRGLMKDPFAFIVRA